MKLIILVGGLIQKVYNAVILRKNNAIILCSIETRKLIFKAEL